MTPDTREIVVSNGVKLVINPAIMSPKLQDIIRRGGLSKVESRGIARLIEDGDRFIELGGGIGYTSSVAALQNKAESITTIEANPGIIEAIRETHALNNVTATVVNAVVMPRKTSATVPFFIHKHFNSSSLAEPRKKADILKVVDVPVISLEEMIAAYSPTLFMIDIEGAELSLLDGAILTGINKVYVELHPGRIGDHGVRQIFDLLSRQDFAYDTVHSVKDVVLFRRLKGFRHA